MSNVKTEIVARVIIYNASKMSKVRQKHVAAWIKNEAKDLIKKGNEYSGRMAASCEMAVERRDTK